MHNPQSANLSADSSVSANKLEVRGGARRTSSGSSHDHSGEEEDAETEAGQFELTNDPNNIKRLRRMLSKRESAKRSRRRKEEYLVDSLKGENSRLYKQLIDATHHFRSAGTNNRVLKSYVETLRIKVIPNEFKAYVSWTEYAQTQEI